MKQININFRPANSTDFDFVYKVYNEPNTNPYFLYEPCSKEEFKNIFEELRQRDRFLITQNNQEACGIVTVIAGKGRTSHIATIATLGILKSHQGQGLGKAALQLLIDDLEKTYKRIELTVEADNPKALKLYQDLGFIVEGTMKSWLKRRDEDVYVDEIMLGRVG